MAASHPNTIAGLRKQKKHKGSLFPDGNPRKLPAKVKKGRYAKVVLEPGKMHLDLKTYLLRRRLVVERSLNPITKAESKAIDGFLVYLRSLERKE